MGLHKFAPQGIVIHYHDPEEEVGLGEYYTPSTSTLEHEASLICPITALLSIIMNLKRGLPLVSTPLVQHQFLSMKLHQIAQSRHCYPLP